MLEQQSLPQKLLLVGLNHRTAPLHIREQIVTDAANWQLHDNNISEVVLVATCNRFEIYVIAADGAAARQAILERLNIAPHYLYIRFNEDAICHLMRVAAGADSMILGEQQILGQIKAAYEQALDKQMTGAILSRLFTQAIHAGKRARSETDISRYTTSMSHAAVRLAEENLGSLGDVHALVLGAGEMSQLAAQALERHAVGELTCINRSYENAVTLAEQFNGQAATWNELPHYLQQVDLIITATSAPYPVIRHADLIARENPVVIIDIALPRDVEMLVQDLEHITLYDMDALQDFVTDGMQQREAAISDVERIISEEIRDFRAWFSVWHVSPVIVALREKAKSIADTELKSALNKLGEIDNNQQDVIERMVHRIVNKLMYAPTAQLRQHAAEGELQYADIVQDLFELDDEYAVV